MPAGRAHLARYTRTSDLTHASMEAAATRGADTILPDRYGLHTRGAWDVFIVRALTA